MIIGPSPLGHALARPTLGRLPVAGRFVPLAHCCAAHASRKYPGPPTPGRRSCRQPARTDTPIQCLRDSSRRPCPPRVIPLIAPVLVNSELVTCTPREPLTGILPHEDFRSMSNLLPGLGRCPRTPPPYPLSQVNPSPASSPSWQYWLRRPRTVRLPTNIPAINPTPPKTRSTREIEELLIPEIPRPAPLE